MVGRTLPDSPELKPLVESVQLLDRLLLVLVCELSLLSLRRSLKLALWKCTSPYSDCTLPGAKRISTLLLLRVCLQLPLAASGSVNDLLRVRSRPEAAILSLGQSRTEPCGLDCTWLQAGSETLLRRSQASMTPRDTVG